MMNDRYPVPAGNARAELTIQKSRFIASAGRVESAEAARAFIQAIRAEFPDANHHVYAWRAGFGSSVSEGMSDDGEPSGTSGPPTLAILRGSGLGDVVIVTTRYFGGILLGTGGLTRAYSDSARAVLAVLPIEQKILRSRFGIALPYPLYERALLLLESCDAEIEDRTFDEEVTLFVRLPTDRTPEMITALRELSAGRVEPVFIESGY